MAVSTPFKTLQALRIYPKYRNVIMNSQPLPVVDGDTTGLSAVPDYAEHECQVLCVCISFLQTKFGFPGKSWY